jgi:two-component system LytT family response regulator
MIRTLIVDDEPLARRRVRALLDNDPDISVEGECGNGEQAIQMIISRRPDLVFLDVQMPAIDGFGVLKALDRKTIPAIIFVTAYDKYAVEAFSARALDFLLKPFNQERFDQALQRAKELIGDEAQRKIANQKLLQLIDQLGQGPSLDRLVIKVDGKHIFLRGSEVQWIDAEGDYARLHLQKRSYLIRETMHTLSTRLDSARFIRIHRSTIVNIDFIKEAHAGVGSDYIVKLVDGTDLAVSRNYRGAIQKFLDTAL